MPLSHDMGQSQQRPWNLKPYTLSFKDEDFDRVSSMVLSNLSGLMSIFDARKI